MIKDGIKLHTKYFLPYQVSWILDEGQGMLGDKARRVGLTYADSYKSVRDRTTIDYRRDLWFSSADESAAYEYALYCRQWCELYQVVANEILEILQDEKGYKYNNYVVELPTGSRINCMSSNPRRFRSKGGDVVLDEFDWHDDPCGMLDASMPATTWGYNVRLLTTRSHEGTPFDKLVKIVKKVLAGELTWDQAKTLKWSYHFIPITIAIEQGLAEKIYKIDHVDIEARERFYKECRARSRSDDAFNQEYMCMPSSEASTLIPYDLYQNCEDANCLNECGDGFRYAGFDIGREKDLTVYWEDEKVGDVTVARKVIRLRKMPYHQQLEIIGSHIAHPKVMRACGDATGIGDMLVEELKRKYGKVEKVKFTSEVKELMASRVLSRFEDRRTRVPADPEIRESFHSVRKTVTASGNIRFDAARTDAGHADDFWAKCLAEEASHNPIKHEIVWA